MQLATLTYSPSNGWSAPFPELDGSDTLVLVFGAAEYIDDPAAIAELRTAFPHAHLAGCSSSGEIHGTQIADGTLSVAIAKFERSHVRSACAEAGDSFEAGAQLARDLNASDLRGVLVLSDGLQVNGSELVGGFNSVLPKEVVVTGGLAGDGDRFTRTWVLEDGKPRAGAVTAIGLYGARVHIGHGSKGGWDIFGPERVVTRAEGNVLYELDHKPALKLYKEYLGERASGLPATGLLFPLAIRKDTSDDKQLVRTILAIDEEEQSMTFAGDLPVGWRAQLMRANFDRLVDGAQGAAQIASQAAPGASVLTVAISCVGRRLVLGERTEEEVEATLEAMPEGAQQVGFYSYGEISPYTDGTCDLHNQTMTLTTIRED